MGKQIIGIDRMCTSEALSDTFILVKPTSSNACTALSADSDRASGEGQPYLSSSGRSSDPPLTPTRRGIPSLVHRLDDFFDFPPGPDIARIDPDAIDDFSGF